jgi:sec-independent protein translocase protein TatB
MFDIGWTELLVIGVVALIVIGPKDLPDLFRTLGRFTAKLRSMAREFQQAMDSAADAAGAKDMAKDLKDLNKIASPEALGMTTLKEAAQKFERWDPLKDAGRRAPKAAPVAAGAAKEVAAKPAKAPAAPKAKAAKAPKAAAKRAAPEAPKPKAPKNLKASARDED